MENRRALLESVNTNINLMRRINEKSKTTNGFPVLKGIYADDIKLILEDYLTVKESYLALLASSGQDSDRITELTILNDTLSKQNRLLVSKNVELTNILDAIYDIIHN